MKKIIFLLAVVFAYNSSFAETGLELIQQASKAMKAEKRSEFTTIKRTMTSKQQGMSTSITFYKKGNDKYRLEIKTPMGEQVIIKNADVCAVIAPMVQDLNPEQWGQIYNQIVSQDSNPNEYMEEEGVEFELIGTEDFNGKSCQKIKVKTEEAQEGIENSYIYIDGVTKWMSGLGLELAEEQGKIEILFSDMKKVKGMVYAGLIKTMYNGQEVNHTSIDNFEVNIELEDSLFVKP